MEIADREVLCRTWGRNRAHRDQAVWILSYTAVGNDSLLFPQNYAVFSILEGQFLL